MLQPHRLILLLLLSSAWTAGASNDESTRVPVLLELFTSEGCSSCPPADHLLEVLDQKQPVAGADLIVLSEHVDYWDRLGWRDPFSSAVNTARQQEYTNRFKMDGVYTPQVVVDGRFSLVGSDSGAIVTAIGKAIHEQKLPLTISGAQRNGSQVTAQLEVPASSRSGDGGQALLYVAIASNREQTRVVRGENAGRSLVHVSVLRTLKLVGTVRPGAAFSGAVSLSLHPEVGDGGSRLVAFVQDAKTGRILGVAATKVSP